MAPSQGIVRSDVASGWSNPPDEAGTIAYALLLVWGYWPLLFERERIAMLPSTAQNIMRPLLRINGHASFCCYKYLKVSALNLHLWCSAFPWICPSPCYGHKRIGYDLFSQPPTISGMGLREFNKSLHFNDIFHPIGHEQDYGMIFFIKNA